MIQLACKLSWELIDLLRRGEARVDWVNIWTWDDLVGQLPTARGFAPIPLHTLRCAGVDPEDIATPEGINRAVMSCSSPHAAINLASYDFGWKVPTPERGAVDRLISALSWWEPRLTVPLLVENMIYTGPAGNFRYMIDPDVIAEVCERTARGLLLNLAHARVAAWYIDEDARAYLTALPLGLTRKIHVNGPSFDSARCVQDGHLAMADEDFDLLGWTLLQVRPMIVTLEYGGTGPRLERRSNLGAVKEQLRRLVSYLE